MSHSEKCPVCEGTGKIKDVTCHGCAGLGWITLQDNNIRRYPTYPWPIYRDPYHYQPNWTRTSKEV